MAAVDGLATGMASLYPRASAGRASRRSRCRSRSAAASPMASRRVRPRLRRPLRLAAGRRLVPVLRRHARPARREPLARGVAADQRHAARGGPHRGRGPPLAGRASGGRSAVALSAALADADPDRVVPAGAVGCRRRALVGLDLAVAVGGADADADGRRASRPSEDRTAPRCRVGDRRADRRPAASPPRRPGPRPRSRLGPAPTPRRRPSPSRGRGSRRRAARRSATASGSAPPWPSRGAPSRRRTRPSVVSSISVSHFVALT